MASASTARLTAQGVLIEARLLLNSWEAPYDPTVSLDRFEVYADENGVPSAERDMLRELRDNLRVAVERPSEAAEVLNAWIDRLHVHPKVNGEKIVYRHRAGVPGTIVASCLTALGMGQWWRLKACPGCGWVFYDYTRNGRKRWCLISDGGPEDRACGTAADMRAHRERAHDA